jgi:hypothetical protein
MRPPPPMQVGFFPGNQLDHRNLPTVLEPLTNHVHLVTQWMCPPGAANRFAYSQSGETRKSFVMNQEQPTPPYLGENLIEA